jgi:hypothetical protein
MGRRLSNVLTLLSAVALLVVVALWVRSYLPDHFWCRWVDGRLMMVTARDGEGAKYLRATYFDDVPDRSAGPRAFLRHLRAGAPPEVSFTFATPPPPPFVLHRVLGIEAGAVHYFGNEAPRYRVVTIPAAYLAAPLSVLPALWLLRLVRRRRRGKAGRCAGCGYDLRASQGRCPECGSNVVAVAA